jgi:hypothetical protein
MLLENCTLISLEGSLLLRIDPIYIHEFERCLSRNDTYNNHPTHEVEISSFVYLFMIL